MSTNADNETVRKWRDLVTRLIYGTNMNSLVWSSTSDENVFLTKVGRAMIQYEQVSVRGDEEDRAAIQVSVLNKNGELIDRFNDEDLGEPIMWRQMSGFLSQLSRKVSGADAYLDDILGQLDADPSQPKADSEDDEIPF